MANAPAIGIDLGTTYSCVAVFQDGKVHIIPNDHNNRVTPSFVAFTENERLIGEAAKSQVTKNPENTVWDSKRLIGRNYFEPSVQEDLNHLPFKVVNSNGKAKIEIKYKNKKKQFSPEEISSMVLSKMKSVAEAYIGQPVTNAVITVPAYFNDEQRQATKDAGQIAGLNVMRIINEPTAAAIAYGLNKYIQKEVNILVFDLGGGTFDVSILKIDDGVFEVKSTCGNTHLGGEDFDNRLLDYCVGEFKQKYGKTLDNKAVRRLRNECEQAKRTLSSAKMADIYAASLCEQIDYRCVLTREKFEQLCQDLFQATLKPVEQALADAKIDKSQIDEVVLVGGSTRIPKIQQMLQEFFNGKNLNKSINPDEAVAYGAAVQAAILNGDKSKILQELLLIDVAPLSLGIQTSDGKMDPLIKSNTSIPTKETKQFSTSVNGQKELIICVLEGDRLMAKDNNKLDEFWLRGITAMPRGIPNINVTFTINENGILNVCAEEIGNANKAELTITNKNSRRLSKDDILKMKKDAEKYREEDEKQRIRLEALSGLDSYLYKVNRSINNAATKSKMSSKDLSSVVRKAKEIQDWFDKNQNADKKQFDQKFIELQNAYEVVVPKSIRFK